MKYRIYSLHRCGHRRRIEQVKLGVPGGQYVMPSGYGDGLERSPESTCPARDQNTHGISFPCWYQTGQPCSLAGERPPG